MTLEWPRSDTLPPWEPGVTVDGEPVDLSVFTNFAVTVTNDDGTVVELSPTVTGRLGSALVEWAAGDLDLPPGYWTFRLQALIDTITVLTIKDTCVISSA